MRPSRMPLGTQQFCPPPYGPPPLAQACFGLWSASRGCEPSIGTNMALHSAFNPLVSTQNPPIPCTRPPPCAVMFRPVVGESRVWAIYKHSATMWPGIACIAYGFYAIYQNKVGRT